MDHVTSKLIYFTYHLLAVLHRLAQFDPEEVTPSPVSCQMLLPEPSCHTHPKKQQKAASDSEAGAGPPFCLVDPFSHA